MSELATQATIFSRYLIDKVPATPVIERYEAYFRQAAAMSIHDKKLLDFILRHRWAIGPIDAALALIQPQSEIRHRLYVVFALLETEPTHAESFLTQQRSWWLGAGLLLGCGLRSVYRAVLGLLLIKGVVR